MGFGLDSQILRDRLDNLFQIGGNRHDIVHHLFRQHAPPDTEWRQHHEFMVYHALPDTKLVRFHFDADFDTSEGESQAKIQSRIDDRLRYVQSFMSTMAGPDEDYHLTVEERPHINDPDGRNLVTYQIHGVIVPKGA